MKKHWAGVNRYFPSCRRTIATGIFVPTDFRAAANTGCIREAQNSVGRSGRTPASPCESVRCACRPDGKALTPIVFWRHAIGMHTQLLNRRQLLFGAAAMGLVGPVSGSSQICHSGSAQFTCSQASTTISSTDSTTLAEQQDALHNSARERRHPRNRAGLSWFLYTSFGSGLPVQLQRCGRGRVSRRYFHPGNGCVAAARCGSILTSCCAKFDPCRVGIPAGSTFYIKTYATWVAGGFPLISGTAP